MHPGEETILGARTSQGKTALSTQVLFQVLRDVQARYAAGDDFEQVILFSPEMSMKQILLRYACGKHGIPLRDVQRGRLTPEQRQLFQSAGGGFPELSPHLEAFTGRSLDVMDVVSACQEASRNGKIALGVVDYLQRINGQGKTPYERATDVSRRLKDLCNTLDFPMLVMAQVRRPDPKIPDSDKEAPTMFDLRDSGSIEQDSDNVIMLHNPPDLEKSRPYRTAHLQFEKQRNGPLAKIELRYWPRFTRFDDVNVVKVDGE